MDLAAKYVTGDGENSWRKCRPRPASPGPSLKPVKASLYAAMTRNRQGVPMKQRDAEQRQRKQDEFGWKPEDED
jgi:hypothetical protein